MYIRWLRWVGVITLFLAVLLTTPSQIYADDDDNNYVPGEVIVRLANANDLTAIASQYRLHPMPIDQFGARPIYRMRILDNVAPPVRAAQLEADLGRRVLYAEPNYLYDTPEGRQRSSWVFGGDGEAYHGQWALAKTGFNLAHASNYKGQTVIVAVLDTGVDPSHPALAGRLTRGYDFVKMDFDPREEGLYGQNLGYGHGTHVAGIIALAAPRAMIMPVRVLDPNGMGNVWVLAEGLQYAVDNGADIINLSLGTRQQTDLLDDLIDAMTCGDDNNEDKRSTAGVERSSGMNDDGDDDDDDDDPPTTPTPEPTPAPAQADEPDICNVTVRPGVVVVAAAGNSGTTTPEYPAAEGATGVLAVAASTTTDTLASFSTHGSWVHIAAPGENILSAVPGGRYAVWSGTSMATPFAAAEVALLWSAHPTLTPAQVVERVMGAATPINAPVPVRLDVAAALGLR